MGRGYAWLDTGTHEAMNNASTNSKQTKSSGWRSLLIWVGLAVLLRWQVLEPRWIPSGSMLPTLQIEDKILIEKIRPRLHRLRKSPLKQETIVGATVDALSEILAKNSSIS